MTIHESLSLGEALPLEMTRVRDDVLPVYVEIGPAGAFAAGWMRKALDDATKAMMEQDPVEMLRCYQLLKDAHL